MATYFMVSSGRGRGGRAQQGWAFCHYSISQELDALLVGSTHEVGVMLRGILMPNKGRYRYNLSLVYGVDEWRQDEQRATLVVVKSARRFETGTDWY